MTHRAIDDWRQITLPRVERSGWTDHEAKAGLSEIKRLRCLLDAAQAALVGIVAKTAGRDTRAQLARELSMSSAEANRAVKVAEVTGRVPGAADALANGEATADHLVRLAPVTDPLDAAQLLTRAPECSPEDFGKAVDKFRLDADQSGWRERQHARRFLSFFNGEDGCVGLRGLLPSTAGERVKAALNGIVDDEYRKQHPQRTQRVSDNDVEPRERRMADALVSAVLGESGEQGETSDGRGGGRTSVIVTVDAETLSAEVVSGGPITADDVVDLVSDARTDLYAMIRGVKGNVLRFGRDRRLATPLQRLVLAVRDGGCSVAGCTAHWSRCDAHHEPPFEDGGRTDIETMDLRCSALHHPHRHEHGPPEAARGQTDPTAHAPPGRRGSAA